MKNKHDKSGDRAAREARQTKIGRLSQVFLGVVAVGCLISQAAVADDIDIYTVPSSFAAAPNVLVLLDNTANWSAANNAWKPSSIYTKCLATDTVDNCRALIEEFFYVGANPSVKRPWAPSFGNSDDNARSLTQGQVEVRALKKVLSATACSGASDAVKVNLGIAMLSSKSSASNGDSVGVIAQAVKPLQGTATTTGSTCKSLIEKLNAIDANINDNDWKAPANANYGAAYYEIFKYFGGHANPTGALSVPTVPGTPVGSTGYGPTRFSSLNSLDDGNAFTDSSRLTYKSPIGEGGECARNYVVLVGNQFPNEEPSGPQSFSGLGYTPTNISGGLPSNKQVKADEWAAFLANADLNVAAGQQIAYTYALNVYNAAPDANQGLLLRSMATVGGMGPSGYYEVNGDLNGLIRSFMKILTNVAAVDSVFTATSLPVSTTTQGSFLNQLFVGMFRPDENARPRWWGNLKQYELAFDSNRDLVVVDKSGEPAIDRSSGFFAANSASLWSHASNFFAAKPLGSPKIASDVPDGAVVEKGGAAQVLRQSNDTSTEQADRVLLSASSTTTSSTNLPAISTGLTGSDQNGVTSVVLTADEVAWIRGLNNVSSGEGVEYFVGQSTDGQALPVRASIHGDVLHSRPVALNYGKDSSDKDNVVVFYGTNDGLLHAIDGRKGSTGGREYWSFMPPESYASARRVRNNDPEVLLPVNNADGSLGDAPSGSTAQARQYGVDGPIGVFAGYNSSGVLQKGMIYATMRRGGEALYAFDVTQTINGTKPTLAWTARSSMSDFSRLGQTWSMPKVMVLDKTKYTGGTNVITVFGAGYNPQEDDPTVTTFTNKGKALYVVDAFTGARRLEIVGSGDNAIGAAVAGDVTVVDADQNGQFDRIYFADVRGGVYRVDIGATFASWTVKKIAQVPGKIFHAPDVVVTKQYVAVLFGTGDREKPLVATTSDKFFMIKDTLPSQGNRSGALVPADLNHIATVASNGAISATSLSGANANGCYFSFDTNGEKLVNAPLTVAGTTYFGTNKPGASNSCNGSLGEARSYRFPLFCDVPTSIRITSGGFPPSPVGGLVNIGGELVPFIIGGGAGSSAFEAERPRPPIEGSRKRNFWRVLPASTGNR